MISRKAILGGVLAATLALTGCAGGTGSNGESSDETFLIYMNTPLTGALGNAAQLNVDTLNVAVDAVNADGGILGRQIEVVVADDQLDTTRAVTLLQEQIDKRKPDLVFMGATSNTALALLPLLSRNQIISTASVQSAAINDPAQYPYAFIPYITSLAEAPALLTEMKANAYTKVALLTANDANGQATAEAIIGEFESSGIEVAHESYTPTDIDMTSQLERLRDSNPDVLVIQAFGAATSHILTSRTKLGWDIRTLGHSSMGLGQNMAEISSPADWNNLYLGVFPITAGESPNPEVLADVLAAVKAEGNPMTQSLHYVGVYWDALQLFKKGFEQAGSTDADAVKEALENLKPNPEIDAKLVTWPVEYQRWSADNHFFPIPADKLLTFVSPGPFVDGVITPEN